MLGQAAAAKLFREVYGCFGPFPLLYGGGIFARESIVLGTRVEKG